MHPSVRSVTLVLKTEGAQFVPDVGVVPLSEPRLGCFYTLQRDTNLDVWIVFAVGVVFILTYAMG